MVEHTDHGQARVQAITLGRADEGGFGLHAELVQEGQKQDRLSLAVGEQAGPGDIGGSRDVAALLHAQEEIAHPILHELQRRGRPGLGIRGRGTDLCRLSQQRRVRGQRFGSDIERGH